MTQSNVRPVPLIDPQRCDGCGLCVRACPTKALELQNGKAIVTHPLACEYIGMCEAVCPTRAIMRPFEIVIADEEKSCSNSTKVVGHASNVTYNARTGSFGKEKQS